VNVLSELTWDDLKIFQVKGEATLSFDKRFYLKGAVARGDIRDGKNRDSDYDGDNRTNEILRSNSKSKGDNVLDTQIGIGYRFTFTDQAVHRDYWFIPYVGYSRHEQNLRLTDGNQIIDTVDNDLGPFPGLNSTYRTEWEGPWAGVELWLEGPNHFMVFGNLEYHWLDYYAEADWNLRTGPDGFAHPKSFEHTAEGNGLTGTVGFIFQPVKDKSWLVKVSADFQNWETDPGIDKVFFDNGSTDESTLNQANWESVSVNVGLRVPF